MVYDWFFMGCNNALLSTPIIAAQCRDPVIIQQVNKYKTEIDIRIKQIVNIIRSGGGGSGGGGNGSNSSNDTNKTGGGGGGSGGGDGSSGGGNKTQLPDDPCLKNPTLPECIAAAQLPPVQPTPSSDPCIENPDLPECTEAAAAPRETPFCETHPSAPGCTAPSADPTPPSCLDDQQNCEPLVPSSPDENLSPPPAAPKGR
jgi:hypothetical protein